MGTYDDDRIRKLELEILVLQAENRRLTSTLADAAAQHYDGQLAALLGESS
jgi:hypothetical protein